LAITQISARASDRDARDAAALASIPDRVLLDVVTGLLVSAGRKRRPRSLVLRLAVENTTWDSGVFTAN
jgi:hypothetical protein